MFTFFNVAFSLFKDIPVKKPFVFLGWLPIWGLVVDDNPGVR